jgi:hypothetical protein
VRGASYGNGKLNSLIQENRLINIPLETEVFLYQHILVTISSDMEDKVRMVSHQSGKKIKSIIHDALSSYFGNSPKKV